MIPIEAAGTYRFRVLEHAVTMTKNGFPQLGVVALVTAVYNVDSGEWEETYADVDGAEYAWSDADMQTTAYLVLANAEKPLYNYAQVQSAFGWDGKSFAGLNDADLVGKEFLGRVEEDTYNGTTRFRINWIDRVDADPTRGLQKLDAAALKGLDSRFAGMLGGTPTPVKAPAKAPAKAPTPPAKPAAPKLPKADPGPEVPAASDDAAEDADQAPAGTPPTTKGKKKKTSPKLPSAPVVEASSKLDAWTKLETLAKPNVTNEHKSNAFIAAIVAVVGDPSLPEDDRLDAIDEDTITEQQWYAIGEKALDAVPHEKF